MFDKHSDRRHGHHGGEGFDSPEVGPGARAAYDQVPDGWERFGGPRSGPGVGPRGPRGRGGRRGGPWGGGGWGGPRGRRRGGPFRARRGDVRAALLALLAERPMHGYEMIQELSERTEGAWQPSPGSVYPTLTLLEEEGLVVGEEVEGKRRFSLTDAGRTADAERQGPPPWEQVVADEDPNFVELREALASTIGAMKQVFRAGTPAQQAKATAILNDTRRRLYEVLASED